MYVFYLMVPRFMFWRVLGVLLLLATTGCSLSSVVKVTPLSKLPEDQVINGVVYALPESSLDIVITRELENCELEEDPILSKQKGKAIFLPKISTKVELKTSSHPGEYFVLDYSGMNGFFKTGKFDIELDETGMLRSLNIKAKDHTVEAATSVFSSVAKLVSMPSVPIPKPEQVNAGDKVSDTIDRIVFTCSERAKTLLFGVEDNSSKLAQIEADINDQEKQKQALIIKNESIGLTEDEYERLAGLGATVIELIKSKKIKQKRISLYRSYLQVKENVSITPSYEQVVEGSQIHIDNFLYGSSPKEIAKHVDYLESLIVKNEYKDGVKTSSILGERDYGAYLGELLTKSLSVKMTVTSESISGRKINPKSQLDLYEDGANGLLVRTPARGVFKAILGSQESSKVTTFMKKTINLPQAGELQILPFESKIGTNNSLAIEMHKGGELKRVTQEVPTAASSVFVDDFDSIVDSYSNYRTRKLQRVKSREQNEIERLSNEITIEQLKATLTQLKGEND